MPPATRTRAPRAEEPAEAPQRRIQSENARQRAKATRMEPATVNASSGMPKHNYAEHSSEIIENVEFKPGQEPAFVRVAAGKTINMDNFESLRIDVSVTLPCLPSKLDDAYESASEFVTEKMASEEERWLGSSNTKRKANRNR